MNTIARAIKMAAQTRSRLIHNVVTDHTDQLGEADRRGRAQDFISPSPIPVGHSVVVKSSTACPASARPRANRFKYFPRRRWVRSRGGQTVSFVISSSRRRIGLALLPRVRHNSGIFHCPSKPSNAPAQTARDAPNAIGDAARICSSPFRAHCGSVLDTALSKHCGFASRGFLGKAIAYDNRQTGNSAASSTPCAGIRCVCSRSWKVLLLRRKKRYLDWIAARQLATAATIVSQLVG